MGHMQDEWHVQLTRHIQDTGHMNEVGHNQHMGYTQCELYTQYRGKLRVRFILRMGETHCTRVIRGIVSCAAVTTHAMQPSAQCLNLAWVVHCPC